MTRPEILDSAKKMVTGQRQDDYGTPENNFKVIADLWAAWFGHPVSPLDVAMCMTLLKIGRIRTGTATDDSFVDAAGYIACGGEIAAGSPYPDFAKLLTPENIEKSKEIWEKTKEKLDEWMTKGWVRPLDQTPCCAPFPPSEQKRMEVSDFPPGSVPTCGGNEP